MSKADHEDNEDAENRVPPEDASHRARRFREWADSHRSGTPPLSEYAVSRDSIYAGEDRDDDESEGSMDEGVDRTPPGNWPPPKTLKGFLEERRQSIEPDTCCVCHHSLGLHLDEGDGWRCHMLGADCYQCECWLRKDKAEGEIAYYDLLRRLDQRLQERDLDVNWQREHLPSRDPPPD